VTGIGSVIAFLRHMPASWEYGTLGAAVALTVIAIFEFMVFLSEKNRPLRARSGVATKPITLRFENRGAFIVQTPTETVGMAGHVRTPGANRLYVRVFPECASAVANCIGYLLEICHKVGNSWELTDFNEICPLTWANYGTQPITVRPRFGPYLDVFYISEDRGGIVPCIRHEGAPLRMVHPSAIFQSREEQFRFKLQVIDLSGEPLSEVICLKVQIGPRWNQPIVELLSNENSN